MEFNAFKVLKLIKIQKDKLICLDLGAMP